jgi:hypothetical protein
MHHHHGYLTKPRPDMTHYARRTEKRRAVFSPVAKTPAQFTQPAVANTVIVPVSSTSGYAVGSYVTVGAGKYRVSGVTGLNLTLYNTGASGVPAQGTVIATGATVRGW